MTNYPTDVKITNKAGTQTITIRATKISDSIGNKDSVRYIRPNQAAPSANFYNLRRIDESITVSGFIDMTSSNVSGDTTARKAAYRLRTFMFTEDQVTLDWGYFAGTSGTNKITITGFLTQIDIEETAQDIGYDTTAKGEGKFAVTFTVTQGVSKRTS
jgi:hypothetical protein